MWKVYLSRFINRRFLGGRPNQMISSRCYSEHHPRAERLINRFFWWQENHCRESFIWEVMHEKAHKRSTQRQEEAAESEQAAPGILETSA